MSPRRTDIAKIQACIQNSLSPRAIGNKRIVGIVGDAPSHYAKSPPIWNTVFSYCKMNAIYLPLDVEKSALPELVAALRESERVLGVNVTVPYKIAIMDYLDELDKRAAQIKAVNTIVRTENGQLIGYNTDGSGFVESILTTLPGDQTPFIDTLKGVDVLMIGAGGAARAVAFTLAERLGTGRLVICNRTHATAFFLAEEISKSSGQAIAIKEPEVPAWAPRVDLIINCSTKGQGGTRKMADGRVTILEPYSALAPANPAILPAPEYGSPEFYRHWLGASLPDIEENNRESFRLALEIPQKTRFCDLIYHPSETVFLRHGRLSGHSTMNGKGMNIAQAADAFFHKVCRRYLQKRRMHNAKTYRRILQIMSEAW